MKYSLRKSGKGFTLIELLVVTAIIVVVSAVVLANQNKFGGQVLLQNFAYDVALSIRQAQVYGLAVTRSGTGVGATFGASHGMRFNSTPNTTYYLYSDLDHDGLYDASPVNEADANLGYGLSMNIGRGYVISGLCVTPPGGSEVCGNTSIDIIFIRPEPDALISWNDGISAHRCRTSLSQCAESATITLRSPRGDVMEVTVDNNGQISVTKP